MSPLKLNRRGFTLLEMVAVVMIMGIVVAIVSVSLISSLNQSRATAMMQQINSALHLASSKRSDFEVVNVYVDFSSTTLTIYVYGQSVASGSTTIISDDPPNEVYLLKGTFAEYAYNSSTSNWDKMKLDATRKYEVTFKQFSDQNFVNYTRNQYVQISEAASGLPTNYTQIKLDYTDTVGNVYTIVVDCQTGATTTSGF